MNPTPNDVTLPDCLLPLLPLREPTSTESHDNHLSVDIRQTSLPRPTTSSEATARWNHALKQATTNLLQGKKLDAAQWVQQAHAWKNGFESACSHRISISSTEWVVIASCSLALEEHDAAAAFAIRAWDTSGRSWQEDLRSDCSDVRADAMALLAIIRICQHRGDRAAILIQQAISGHRQVGAMEQLAADHMILSVCYELCGNAPKAAEARSKAGQIVEMSLDPCRHCRTSALSDWLTRFGHPRPALLKSSEIV